MDLRRVLAGSPARVAARAAGAARGAGRPRDAAAARRSAAAILAGPDYHPGHAGIFARALSWLARLLRIPSGADGVLGLIVLGGVVAAVAALAALLLGSAGRVRRRERMYAGPTARSAWDPRAPRSSSGAPAAEAAGRFEEAMRLQLAAALTRLDAAGTIRVRRDTTLGQVARSLHSHEFDAAADRFAGVVYGRRPPTAFDATDLRERLAATVQEAGRR